MPWLIATQIRHGRIMPRRVDIIADHFQGGRNDRAIVLVARADVPLLLHQRARVEDEFDAVVQQRLDMAVRDQRGDRCTRTPSRCQNVNQRG
jgi:hypothetical protein